MRELFIISSLISQIQYDMMGYFLAEKLRYDSISTLLGKKRKSPPKSKLDQSQLQPQSHPQIISKKNSVIRTVKNKKVVYCQTDDFVSEISRTLQKQSNSSSPTISFSSTTFPATSTNNTEESDEGSVLEEKKKSGDLRGLRGSKFRGVSKNGNQWQVLIMINKKKRYIGNYRTEEEAATSYDIVAIQNHGKKAKTNFYYSPEQINIIKNMSCVKWKN